MKIPPVMSRDDVAKVMEEVFATLSPDAEFQLTSGPDTEIGEIMDSVSGEMEHVMRTVRGCGKASGISAKDVEHAEYVIYKTILLLTLLWNHAEEDEGMTIAQTAEHVMEACRAARAAGQKEYSHSLGNAFANFDRVSEHLSDDDVTVTREMALLVYLDKHLDGIRAWVDGYRSQREHVTGRITDAIVYLILLMSMLRARTSVKPTPENAEGGGITIGGYDDQPVIPGDVIKPLRHIVDMLHAHPRKSRPLSIVITQAENALLWALHWREVDDSVS